MELKDYKQKSHDYTAKASEIARQINFAGIGIIWIIKNSNENVKLDNWLIIIPLALISISLLLDFLQYFIGGILWITFYKSKEAQGISITSEQKSEPWRSNILYTLYYCKFLFMVVAFIIIIKALFTFYT